VGDSAHAPYGDRSAHYVRKRSQNIVEFLIDQGVKVIVIACNTATAEAAEYLRETLDIPIIGLEPAIKPAVNLSKSGIIGVMATQRTINSERLSELTKRYANKKKILTQACSGLAEQVEAYELSNQKTENLLRQFINPLLDQGADTLILGCTHYPFLLPTIRKIFGTDIQILETGKPVAEQLKRVLMQNKLNKVIRKTSKNSAYKSHISFYNSSNLQKHKNTMQKLWHDTAMTKPTTIQTEIKFLDLA